MIPYKMIAAYADVDVFVLFLQAENEFALYVRTMQAFADGY